MELLINPGGVVDSITAPQIETVVSMATNSLKGSFSFNGWMPDVEMESRGVMDKSLRYPYRDYSLRLWNAIVEWVTVYLSEYYHSDEDIKNDIELQDWVEELTREDCGNLQGFGDGESGRIETRAYLVRAVSMVIFTASVQHSALNYTQASMMQFAPAMPLCGFAPPPKTEKPFESVDQWVREMMPNLEVAKMQLDTAELIGVMQYTVLGEYGRDMNYLSATQKDGLRNFEEILSEIGADIQRGNREERLAGLPPYDVLVPKKIPQSINI